MPCKLELWKTREWEGEKEGGESSACSLKSNGDTGLAESTKSSPVTESSSSLVDCCSKCDEDSIEASSTVFGWPYLPFDNIDIESEEIASSRASALKSTSTCRSSTLGADVDASTGDCSLVSFEFFSDPFFEEPPFPNVRYPGQFHFRMSMFMLMVGMLGKKLTPPS